MFLFYKKIVKIIKEINHKSFVNNYQYGFIFKEEAADGVAQP